MPIISFVTQKGGSGKSTLAINCAVVASQLGKRVLLLDLDAQRTAEKWFQRREGNTPEVLRLDPADIGMALDFAKTKQYEWVLIDTPGRDEPGTAKAIGASDLCVVPCRPSAADLEAVVPTVEVIRKLDRPAAFVLTQTPPRSYRITEAEEALSEIVAVAPVNIVMRAAYQDAQAQGYGVTEFEPEGKAAEETRELWRWIASKARKGQHHGR